MKSKLLFFALAGFAACGPPATRPEAAGTAAPGNLERFADSLVRLDKYSLRSLDTAARYYQSLVPADTVLADSAAVMLLRHVWSVVDSLNQTLLNDTTDYFNLVYNGGEGATPQQKQYQQRLATLHIRLQGDGEGSVYAAPDLAWLVPAVQKKASRATARYLEVMRKEIESPVMLDAGLAVDVRELADRLVASENLLQQTLPHAFATDAKKKNRMYTGVLLLGSDNSPAVDGETLQPVEAFKRGYAYLLAAHPASQAAQRVREWQQILLRRDKEKVEEWRRRYAWY